MTCLITLTRLQCLIFKVHSLSNACPPALIHFLHLAIIPSNAFWTMACGKARHALPMAAWSSCKFCNKRTTVEIERASHAIVCFVVRIYQPLYYCWLWKPCFLQEPRQCQEIVEFKSQINRPNKGENQLAIHQNLRYLISDSEKVNFWKSAPLFSFYAQLKKDKKTVFCENLVKVKIFQI